MCYCSMYLSLKLGCLYRQRLSRGLQAPKEEKRIVGKQVRKLAVKGRRQGTRTAGMRARISVAVTQTFRVHSHARFCDVLWNGELSEERLSVQGIFESRPLIV